MAGNKIFPDTNIILDFALHRKGELYGIEQIFNLSNTGSCDCFISETAISASLYFLEKEKSDSLQIMRNLCRFLKILRFHVNVLHTQIDIFKDREYGLLFFIAIHHKMDFFITRNTKDSKNAPPILQVLTPKQFIKLLHPI